MKILFCYRWNHHEPVYGHQPYLLIHIDLVEALPREAEDFTKYLLSAIGSDLPATRRG